MTVRSLPRRSSSSPHTPFTADITLDPAWNRVSGRSGRPPPTTVAAPVTIEVTAKVVARMDPYTKPLMASWIWAGPWPGLPTARKARPAMARCVPSVAVRIRSMARSTNSDKPRSSLGARPGSRSVMLSPSAGASFSAQLIALCPPARRTGLPVGGTNRGLCLTERMDLTRDASLIVGLVVCFVAAMFLAAAEAALLRIFPIRAMSLAARGSPQGERLAKQIADLPNVLNAVLLSALLAQIGAATLTGLLAERWSGSWGVTLSSIGLTVLLFVYGEAIPKTFAVRHADRVGLALSLPIAVLERVLRPLVKVLVWVADIQMPGKGITMAPTVTEDELRHLAVRAAREGEITEDDVGLIQRAFRLGDRRADDLMVPRTEIVAVSADETVTEALAVALEAGHRRLPVFETSVENIIGMVRLRDLMRVPPERRDGLPVGRVIDEALVVPASKRVLPLLAEMQESETHMAIIVDEYGGTAGLVTVEDIAEELLGSISEGTTAEPIVEVEKGRWSIDASLPVEDLAELIGESTPPGINTVGGLVMRLLGRIPSVGDEVELGKHTLRVAATRRRRVTRVEAGPRSPHAS